VKSILQGSQFDELEFFRGLAASRARALLIGRRALVLLGLPVLTVDYGLRAVRAGAEPCSRRGARPASLRSEERARTLELIDWFCRRYPTGAERLAYVRRAYRRWLATQGLASSRRSGTCP
jgi:hypothetical protein